MTNSREQWLYQNPKALASVLTGIAEAGEMHAADCPLRRWDQPTCPCEAK